MVFNNTYSRCGRWDSGMVYHLMCCHDVDCSTLNFEDYYYDERIASFWKGMTSSSKFSLCLLGLNKGINTDLFYFHYI